jgi:hypothetical protein
VVKRITEKDASDRTGCKLMRSSGRLVGVAEAPEGAERIVVRIFIVETVVGDSKSYGLGWSNVDEVGCGGNSLSPV